MGKGIKKNSKILEMRKKDMRAFVERLYGTPGHIRRLSSGLTDYRGGEIYCFCCEGKNYGGDGRRGGGGSLILNF